MNYLKIAGRVLVLTAAFVLLVAIPLKGVPLIQNWLSHRQHSEEPEIVAEESALPHVVLVPEEADTLSVPDDVFRSMGMTLADVSAAPPPAPLKLDGSLFLDGNSMVHVHSRFAGDVMEIGEFIDHQEPPGNGNGNASGTGVPVRKRSLRPGDRVGVGQLLAIVWSKDLGEKKSELVDSLSRLWLDQEKLKGYEKAAERGAIPDRIVAEARRDVEAGLISVAKAERTLRSWQLEPAEIDEIHAEAERLHQRQGKPGGDELNRNWARVEVRSRTDGTIVEKNVAVGDYISNELDIFKIADLSRLDVLAHVYEDDLPLLEKMPRALREWTIFLKADPEAAPLQGRFARIGPILDPNQHTALVMGWVDNSRGRLRVGQFVTARIDLNAIEGEVAVPVSALVERDGASYVFVQSASHPDRFMRRKVVPVRRTADQIVVGGASEGAKIPQPAPLQRGEQVVAVGGIQLAAELHHLQMAARVSLASQP